MKKYVNLHNYKSRWGFFYQYNIKDLSEIKNYVNLKYQTLTYFGFENKPNKIVQENDFNGIDRIVPVGRSLDMDIIWDGYEINSFLTRTIEKLDEKLKLDKIKILEYQKNRDPYLMIDYAEEVILRKF